MIFETPHDRLVAVHASDGAGPLRIGQQQSRGADRMPDTVQLTVGDPQVVDNHQQVGCQRRPQEISISGRRTPAVGAKVGRPDGEFLGQAARERPVGSTVETGGVHEQQRRPIAAQSMQCELDAVGHFDHLGRRHAPVGTTHVSMADVLAMRA